MSGFKFDNHTHYVTLIFTSELNDLPWEKIDAATKKIAELVHDSGQHSVLIDLTQIDSVPSALVTALVRTWKGLPESNRRFVVIAPGQEVKNELQQTGLTALWTLTDSEDQAYKAIGVTGQTDLDISIPQVATTKEIAAASEPLEFVEQRGFNAVTLNPVLMTMNWGEVEELTTKVVEKAEASERFNVMVDLSNMSIINSGIVASLVRLWKCVQERKGNIVFVSPKDVVTAVIQTSGLAKLWQVVETREEAVYLLGISSAAKVEHRERNVLLIMSTLYAVLAAGATILMLITREDVIGANAQLTALLLGSAAVATGLISLFKDSGQRRTISGIAVAIGLAVLSTLWFKDNPITFGHQLPERNFSGGDD